MPGPTRRTPAPGRHVGVNLSEGVGFSMHMWYYSMANYCLVRLVERILSLI